MNRILDLMKNNPNNDANSPTKAVRKVNKSKSPEAIDALIESLKDENTLYRVAAYKKLIRIGKPAIPALLTTLEFPEIDCYTQDIFRAHGGAASRSLIPALKNDHLKNNAKAALLGLDQDAILPLVRELEDPSLVEEISDIICSLDLRSNHVVRPLINALSHRRLRQGATQVLTDLVLNDVIGERDDSLLVQILSERSTRKIFARYFLTVHSLIPAFIELSGTISPNIATIARGIAQKIATSILIKIGQPAVDQIISSLSLKNTRETSQKILTRMGRPALPALIAVINSGAEIDIRVLAITILGDIKAREATAPLVSLLQRDSSAQVRKECVDSLGKIRDPAVLRDLLVAMESQDVESDVVKVIGNTPVFSRALWSLNRRDNKSYCGKCLHRLEVKKTFYKKNQFIRSYICRNCHSVSRVVDRINRVVLVMDSNLPVVPPENNLLFYKQIESASNKSTLYINWVWHKDPFDFDEVQLKNNREFELEEFIMKIRNDIDGKRRKKRYRSVPVKVYPDVTLTKAQLNALKDTFRKISINQGVHYD